MVKRAVVLLSGGLDSATCLTVAQHEQKFDVVHTLSVDYGQRHRIELVAAARVAQAAGVTDHRVVKVDLRAIGGSALTSDMPVPLVDLGVPAPPGIPVTYVPARNTVLLGLALGLAEVVVASDLFVGVNAIDYSGYPDCREPFIQAFEQLAQVATAASAERGVRFRVHAPLLHMTKSAIIKVGTRLGVPYGLTSSCYDPIGPDGLACGRCASCGIRARGFADAGVLDPTRYADHAFLSRNS
jgi:7-cyano-7-deazaguanine synthase